MRFALFRQEGIEGPDVVNDAGVAMGQAEPDPNYPGPGSAPGRLRANCESGFEQPNYPAIFSRINFSPIGHGLCEAGESARQVRTYGRA